MACCGPKLTPRTALAKYAEALRGQPEDELPTLFPMYTVPLETLLEMTRIEPHEELKARDVLVEYRGSMGNVGFISHQWVGVGHPDPESKQMRIFQEALKAARDDVKMRSISPDIVSEINNPKIRPFPTARLFSEPLFFWYDYFSIPQKAEHPCEQLDAINSIQAYVDKCSFFFALVPVLESSSSMALLSPLTWQGRGWCRLEKAVRELSHDPSWIMVKGPRDMQFISDVLASSRAGSGPVGEGAFTVQEDCLKLRPVLMTVLKRKLIRLLKSKDFAGYRALLNQQSTILTGMGCDFEPLLEMENSDDPHGQDRSNTLMFLHQNGFSTIRTKDSCGWFPIHYAALVGDASLVQDLLALEADPNQGTKKAHPNLGFEAGTPPLSISCYFRKNEVVRLLLSVRASFDSLGPIIHYPLNCAAAVNNAEAVQILCEAGCSPLQRNALGHSCIETAASWGLGLEAMEELVRQASIAGAVDKIDPTPALYLAAISWGGAEVVQRLVAMRADVNAQTADEPAKRTLLMRAMYTAVLWQHRFHKVTATSTFLYHARGGTALMLALVTGNYEFAAALIAAGAQLIPRNARGFSAADLVSKHSAPDFLAEAFEGRVEACRRVAELACGWVKMAF
ncbi:ANKK1 [Symbiodinium necroappetens]|uniref:ANKK1 protein n=1 Tax=Symbiodinium necroappetens TaxID=1628268 RepID=A0A813BAY3_9DINO|nr:ANKK1 [Symbiodinium necroappetens]